MELNEGDAATPGAGAVSLNLNVRGLSQSPTIAIQARCDALAREGRRIWRLGLGQSPFPVPPPVVESLRSNAARKAYLPVHGLPQLREAVAEYHRRRHGVPCSPDDVLVAPGSKELLFLLQLVFYGDLLIPTPAWVSYAPQAQIVGRRVDFVPTRFEDRWRLLPEDLEARCGEDPVRPRVLVLNYPGNPTGVTYDEAELAALAEVARRHRMVVLSDEIYGELHFEGRHASLARFYPEGTIVSSGLSKWCGAGGWRLGTFTFPRSLRWLLEAMAAVASETYTSTSAPIQYAAVRAFQGGLEIEEYLTRARRILASLGRQCADRLRGAGARLADPEGAFYLFPDLGPHRERLAARGIRTSDALCRRALDETGVAFLPGSAFGRPPDELTARLATVDFDGSKAMAAMEAQGGDGDDDAFAREHGRNVLQAIDVLGDWLAR
ncbi:aminotransferase class I/II-fold pyridoxal phosphate-dependent enzyme [Myxococcota bacterium]|nr:aminotransferase class I/II-fold pyridoxal phosphate-dependent enzyme [Myxococcota bacterium]